MTKPLTPKQQRFVDEYMVDLNATQAAIRAGYSAKTAEQQGPRLLGNVRVAAVVEAAKKERAKKTKLDAQWVLDRLQANHDRAMQAEPVRDREGKETGEYTYQGAVANKSLELIGRHLGMFKDKIEIAGVDGSLEAMLAMLPAAVAELTRKK